MLKYGGLLMLSLAQGLPEGEILSSGPLRLKDHKCLAMVAMPISFPFSDDLINFTKHSLGIPDFDLFGIPAFSKRFVGESKTVLGTLNLSKEKHHVQQVVLMQHVDFHKHGVSSRFLTQSEEDCYHKGGLITSMKKIRDLYPQIETRMIYARLVNEQTEIEIVEVFECGRERIRMITPYRFKGIYQCPVAVIFCLDFRLRRETRVCVRDALKIPFYDMIVIPGATKSFNDGAQVSWKAIKVAHDRHGCRKVVAFHHSDCGAYGGAGNFPDPIAEELYHREQINIFQKELYRRYPDIELIKIYARLIKYEKIQFVHFD